MASVTNKPWDGSRSRFTDKEFARSCVLGPRRADGKHELPIREPDGTLNSHAVAAAAAKLPSFDAAEGSEDARRRLLAAYAQMGKAPPDSLSVTAAGPPDMTAHDQAFVSDMLHAHHRIVDMATAHRGRGGHPNVMRFAANVLGNAQSVTQASAGMLPDGKGTPQGPSDYAY